jgi:hypothetical protein
LASGAEVTVKNEMAADLASGAGDRVVPTVRTATK